MEKNLWINLSVHNIARAKEFFVKIGFSFNEQMTTEDMACMYVGDSKVIVMLFKDALFKSFTKNELADTSKVTEVLFSIDAASKEEVDSIAEKAENAGGIVFSRPAIAMQTMYGCGFSDLDGHRWNVLCRQINAD